MITYEDSIPKKSSKYLLNQDIFWKQFNDINFYVEDTDQENLYYEILRKLFPEINIKKIFPLNGKPNVVEHAKKNRNKKKHIYILDLDFDGILNQKVDQKNIFYLEKYSIENYLFTIDAVVEVVKEERPKMKDEFIKAKIEFKNFLKECKALFGELLEIFLFIQKFNLGIENVKNGCLKYCNLSTKDTCGLRENFNTLLSDVETKFKLVSPKMKLANQLKIVRKFFSNIEKILINGPGKYFLIFIKHRIEHLFKIATMNLESFTFRLAKNSSLGNLQFLKLNIESFIN